MKRKTNIQTNIPETVWKEFRTIYYNLDQNRNEALEEAIQLWNEKYKNSESKTDDTRLIKSTSSIIVELWNKFKKFYKTHGIKKDLALEEAIQLYIDKHKVNNEKLKREQ